jgi:hypothetical protein
MAELPRKSKVVMESSISKEAEPIWIRLRWPLTVIVLALIGLLAYLISLWTAKDTLEALADKTIAAGAKAEAIAEKFKKGTITETFLAQLPEIVPGGSGRLELATLNSIEIFKREDMKTVAWDWVYLGTTVSEIKVPVTYRYHLRLSDPWKLDVSDKTCIVLAPRFRPTQPPSIHTDGMEKKSDRGWLRFNQAEEMAELEKSITPTLKLYARDKRHMDVVREECRKTVAQFVRDWLLKEKQWRTDRFHAIKVIFSDEREGNVESIEPSIELNE